MPPMPIVTAPLQSGGFGPTVAPTLAQSFAQDLLSGGPDIRPLPEPSLIESMLFGGSLALWIGLTVGAVVLFVGLSTRGKPKLGALLAALALLAAAGAWATSALVTTEREVILGRTEALIDATVAADTRALGDLLDPEVRLSIRGLGTDMPKGRILTLVDAQLGGPYRITDHAILERQATLDGPTAARAQFSIRADGERFGRVGSWWAIDWRERPEGWRVVAIEALYIPGLVGAEPGP